MTTTISLEDAWDFIWHPRRSGADSRPMKSLNDNYLLNVIKVCRAGNVGANDRQGALDAALCIARARGLSTNRPVITESYRLAQIVQDIAIAFREEGLVETSPAAARVWAAYERELAKESDNWECPVCALPESAQVAHPAACPKSGG